jgi:hypothetical protein
MSRVYGLMKNISREDAKTQRREGRGKIFQAENFTP